MKLVIKPQDTIKSIQDKIQEAYSNIKIEFFSKEHKEGKLTNVKFQYFNKDMNMESLGLKSEMSIEINPDTIIWDIEKKFEQLGNLHIQVFRKGGEVWIETSKSDQWSIGEANSLGDISTINTIVI